MISPLKMDDHADTSTENRPLSWLLVLLLLATFGVAACTLGVRDLIDGESHMVWKRRGGGVAVDKTFTGGMAVAFGVAQLAVGLGCLPLSLLARRALEAHARRGSYLALPRWQAVLIVLSVLLAGGGMLFLMVGRFL